MPATSFLAEMIRAGQAGVTDPYLRDAAGADKMKVTGGSGALVTGTLTINTGLTSISSFQTTLLTQPNGTGVASHQILVSTITTGSALVTAYSISSVTGATTAANTSTGTFSWLAYGT